MAATADTTTRTCTLLERTSNLAQVDLTPRVGALKAMQLRRAHAVPNSNTMIKN